MLWRDLAPFLLDRIGLVFDLLSAFRRYVSPFTGNVLLPLAPFFTCHVTSMIGKQIVVAGMVTARPLQLFLSSAIASVTTTVFWAFVNVLAIIDSIVEPRFVVDVLLNLCPVTDVDTVTDIDVTIDIDVAIYIGVATSIILFLKKSKIKTF